MTREPFEMIEIDLPQCARTYGSAPCAAALGTTGVRKCYNTRATCQDTANFLLGTARTLRFCRPGPIPTGVLVFPVLASVNQSSASVNVVGSEDQSGGIGRRGILDFKIDDFTYHERGIDPYQAERVSGAAQTDEGGYRPESRGTFLAKLKARWPNYNEAEVRYIRAYLVDGALTDVSTYYYFLEKFDGPADGVVSGSAVDVFSIMDPKKALAPKPSLGSLNADITNVATSLTVTPTGAGAGYAASGWICVGSEIMGFTRSGDTFTVTRGQRGTTAAAHQAGDSVQQTLSYRGRSIHDVVNDLLTTYTTAPATYRDYSVWQAEVTRWAGSILLTTDICQPTPVVDLLSELSVLGCNIVGDEKARKIRLKMNRPVYDETVYSVSDDSAKSIEQEDRDIDRITQVMFHSRRADPTKQLTDEANYLARMLTVNPEAVALYGASKTRKIFTRWLDQGDNVTVSIVSWRTLRRFENQPKRVKIRVDARDKAISLLDVVKLSSVDISDVTGKTVPTQFQVVRRSEPIAYHEVELDLQLFQFNGKYGVTSPNSQPVYGSATTAQKERYVFAVDETTMKFPDGSGPYRAI